MALLSKQPWAWKSGYKKWGLFGRVKPEAEWRPKFYFYAFEDFDTGDRVFYPFGLHWIVKAWIDIRHAMYWVASKPYRRTFVEKLKWDMYQQGWKSGYSSGEGRLTPFELAVRKAARKWR